MGEEFRGKDNSCFLANGTIRGNLWAFVGKGCSREDDIGTFFINQSRIVRRVVHRALRLSAILVRG